MIRISIAEAGKAARLLTFNKDEVTLGREAHLDLPLTGKGVSSRHCRLVNHGNVVYVEDLGSTNGTYVNRARISVATPVTSSDEVVVAIYQIQVLTDAASGLHRAATDAGPPSQSLPSQASASPPTTPDAGPTAALPSLPQVRMRADSVSLPGAVQASAPQSVAAPEAGTAAPTALSRSVKTRVAGGDDLEWGREWEQIDRLATEWFKRGRPTQGLLRGAALGSARRWLSRGRGKHPQPTSTHRQFIEAGARRRGLRVFGILTAVTLVLGGAGVGGVLYMKSQSTDGGTDGGTDGEIASASVDLGGDAVDPRGNQGDGNAQALAERAANLVEGNPELAVLLAAEAVSRLSPADAARPDHAAAFVLRQGLARIASRPLRGHSGAVAAVAVSMDGSLAATATDRRGEPVRLWDLQRPGVITPWLLSYHAGQVEHLAITGDGHWLVTAGDDGIMMRWDLTASDPPSTGVELDGQHRSPITALQLRGSWLVTGDATGRVRWWNVGAARPTAVALKGHEVKILGLAVSPDGTRVASAAEDGTGKIWTLDAGTPRSRVATITRPEEYGVSPLTAVAISPDAQWVLTGDADGNAWLWKGASSRPNVGAPPPLEGKHRGRIAHVGFSHDGAVAITAGADGKAVLWDMGRANPNDKVLPWEGHKGPITAMDVTGARLGEPATPLSGIAHLLTASEDATARRWNLDGRDGAIDVEVLGGHSGSVLALDASENGQWVITGSQDETARVHAVWRADRPDTRRVPGLGAARIGWGHAGPVRATAMNAGSNRLVTGADDGTARVWDLVKPGPLSPLGVLGGHAGSVRAVAIDPPGKYVATGDTDGALRLWSLEADDPGKGHLPLVGHTQEIRAVLFTQSEPRRLISVSTDATARVWDMTTRDPNESVVVLKHDDEVIAAAASADGRWLLTATGTTIQALLWDLQAEDPAAANLVLKGHADALTVVAVGPKGHWAATGSRDYKVHLYDLTKDKPKRTKLREHEAEISALSFSPNGQWLATADGRGGVRLWDLSSKHPDENARALLGPKGGVQSLAWSADSRWVVGAAADRAVYLWGIEGGDPVVLEGHEGVVSGVDIARGGEFVVSAGYDGTARSWPLTADALVPIACARVGRWLTEEEWADYVGGEYVARCDR